MYCLSSNDKKSLTASSHCYGTSREGVITVKKRHFFLLRLKKKKVLLQILAGKCLFVGITWFQGMFPWMFSWTVEALSQKLVFKIKYYTNCTLAKTVNISAKPPLLILRNKINDSINQKFVHVIRSITSILAITTYISLHPTTNKFDF